MSQNPEELIGAAFGAGIKERREALGLSQERLGGMAGTTRATIASIEQGHIPKVALIYALAEALETNLWELLPQDRQGFQLGPEGSGAAPEWVAGDLNSEPTDLSSVALTISGNAKKIPKVTRITRSPRGTTPVRRVATA